MSDASLSEVKYLARKLFLVFFNIQEQFLHDVELVPISERYREYRIPKRNGHFRWIHEPIPSLKIIQQLILRKLYDWPTHRKLFGFKPGLSIIDNAWSHVIQNRDVETDVVQRSIMPWCIKIDLKNAFPSVRVDTLVMVFESMFSYQPPIWFKKTKRLSAEIAFTELLRSMVGDLDATGFGEAVCQEFISLLVSLVTYKGRMPQGAPTSPYLLNLVLTRRGTADRLGEIFIYQRLTIYADDITISLEWKPSGGDLKHIRRVLFWDGFRVNRNKTRITNLNNGAHRITGLTLYVGNDGQPRLGVPRQRLAKLRGQIHRAAVILESGRLPDRESDGLDVSSIIGQIAFLRSVYPSLPERVRPAVDRFLTAKGGFS